MALFKINVPEIDWDAHVFYIEAENEKEAEEKLEAERASGRISLPMDIHGDSQYIGWGIDEVCFPVTED